MINRIGPFDLYGLVFEADKAKEADEPIEDDSEATDNPLEGGDSESDSGDGDNPLDDQSIDGPSAVTPQGVASQQECEFVDLILRAMTFSPKEIPTKALVVFDFMDPDRIVHFVKRVLNVHGKQKTYQSDNPLVGEGEELPFLARHKHVLAQLLLKALKFDSKDMTVDSSLLSDEVTPENARSIEKELSMLLAL